MRYGIVRYKQAVGVFIGWYVYQPTQADYRMLAGAVDEYLQVFQRQEEAQENSPQMC